MDDLVCVWLQRRVDRSAAMELLREFTTVTLTGKGWLCFARRELPRLDAAGLPYREASPAEAEEVLLPFQHPFFQAQQQQFEERARRYRAGERDPAPDHAEAWVREHLPLETMSPKEWVGRHGARICVFSFHWYRFADPAVDAWVRRAGEILTNSALRKECLERAPDG